VKPTNDLGEIHLKKTIIFLISYVHYPVSFLFEVTVVVLNLASPSLVRDDVQSVCKKMIAQLMDTPENTVGLMVCPVFSYKTGTLFSDEYALLKGMADMGVHVDLQCQLVFDPKSKAETRL